MEHRIAKVEMTEETLTRLIEAGHLSKGEYMVTTITREIPIEVRYLERKLKEQQEEARAAYKKVKDIEKQLNEWYQSN